MSRGASSDASAVLIAAALAGLFALFTAGRVLLDAVHRLLGVLVVVGVVSLVVLVALALRVWATRRGLRRRAAVLVLAPDSFDPGLDAVLRFASQLTRVRRVVGGWFEPRASAVRVLLDTDGEGRVRYSLVVPGRSLPALRSALSVYDRVEIRAAQPTVKAGLHVVRCELRLARASHEALAHLGLDPDPLQGFTRLLGRLEDGESAQVALDLLPFTPGGARRARRRLMRDAHRRTGAAQPSVAEVLGISGRGRQRQSAAEVIGARAERAEIDSKLAHAEPLFQAQVLVRCASRAQGRARDHMQGLLGCFDAFAAANSFRVVGMRLFGLAFLGSDLPGRSSWFDRRLATGLFRPARRSVLSAREVAGFLKPPTVNCRTQRVLRLGPAVYPPPRSLPGFTGQDTVLPLGRVSGERGERHVGVELRDTVFSYIAGRSRYGKSELAITQFVHIARSGKGAMFIDPHEDAIARIKSCLTDGDLPGRIIELDLTGPRSWDSQPGWNLLAVRDLPPEARERRVEAIVDSFASALGWGERNSRALTITTQATAALVELAAILPPEMPPPTVFQITTLLSQEQWRNALLPFLSTARQQFFTERFPRLSEDAITPVTNLIDRLRACTPLAALLGSSCTSYDIARAMSRGQIVLACPGADGARDKLVANLLVYDLLHAAKARARVAPEGRREFYVFLDEIQTYDGASSGNLAALLEQTAKYGIRAVMLNQNPERLTPATLNALTTNRSHLLTTALDAHGAALVAKEWGKDPGPEAITHLPRHTFLTQLTHNGELTDPFLIKTLPVPEMYPDTYKPGNVPEIQPAIDEASGREPAQSTLAALDTLDGRIRGYLEQNQPQRESDSDSQREQHEPSRSPLPRIARKREDAREHPDHRRRATGPIGGRGRA